MRNGKPARGKRSRQGWFPFVLVGLPLAAFCAVLTIPLEDSIATEILVPASLSPGIDAQFARCSGRVRYTCVVDGDTLWVEGTKIRLADINTPEISKPGCAFESELGERATARLVTLLNSGPFVLERDGPDEDRYGRKLRIAVRNGKSLGDTLVAEGLAEEWTGRRRNWCA
ncbi:thermonuclease family protein [Aurantiacibacter xanthus]|uniref:Thermonuclease family protein n=2 Tax=Aurantiacibacter xanthus TaxID=1784712 RepID=A0A3A1P7M3_9SPHN|nr:thermonuclease family protein [Aurantiacibacter xanthus]